MNRWLQDHAKAMFFRSLQNLKGSFVEIVCPEDTYTFGEPGASLRAMALIHDERFFVRAVTGADIGMCESYMDGDWTTPNLVDLVRVAVRNLRLLDSQYRVFSSIRAMAFRLRHRFGTPAIRSRRKNTRAHCDLGTDFYRLFLDSEMAYSCAYFRYQQDSLEIAQLEKLDLACRKLHLRPGDRVLEIGCGWGSFAIHAARHFGSEVTAVTTSKAQYQYATERLTRTGVAPGSVRFVREDYRRLQGQYDKIVSIETFGSSGFHHYDEFFKMCDRLLAPEGSMLLQTMTLPEWQIDEYRKHVDWIQTYIVPDTELASIAEIGRSLLRGGQLILTDTENISTHYAKTLAHWRERFFQRITDVRRLGFDERFQRMWDFYLGWSEGAFLEQYIGAAQLIISKKAVRERIPRGLAMPSASPLSA